jgi:hypothetical protein
MKLIIITRRFFNYNPLNSLADSPKIVISLLHTALFNPGKIVLKKKINKAFKKRLVLK